MAASQYNWRVPSSLFVFLLATVIGCTPILAAILTSAPSAKVAR